MSNIAELLSLPAAYLRGYSTETAIIRVLNDVYRAADDGSRTILLQLDLSVEFDTIDRKILIARLEYTLGIAGCTIQWLDSYLTDRSQFIRVSSERSSTATCFRCPPRISPWPTAFQLVVAPILLWSLALESATRSNADGTQLYISLKDPNALPLLSVCFETVHTVFALIVLPL